MGAGAAAAAAAAATGNGKRGNGGVVTVCSRFCANIACASRASLAQVAADGGPQAAVVGYAVSDRFELIFDTLTSTGAARNLRRDARIALVVGWDAEQTLQLEGVADELSGQAPGEDLLSFEATQCTWPLFRTASNANSYLRIST